MSSLYRWISSCSMILTSIPVWNPYSITEARIRPFNPFYQSNSEVMPRGHISWPLPLQQRLSVRVQLVIGHTAFCTSLSDDKRLALMLCGWRLLQHFRSLSFRISIQMPEYKEHQCLWKRKPHIVWPEPFKTVHSSQSCLLHIVLYANPLHVNTIWVYANITFILVSSGLLDAVIIIYISEMFTNEDIF